MTEDNQKRMYIYAPEFTKHCGALAYDYNPSIEGGNLGVEVLGESLSPLELLFVARGMAEDHGYEIILDYANERSQSKNHFPIPKHMRGTFSEFEK
jgi:hypothetical protein